MISPLLFYYRAWGEVITVGLAEDLAVVVAALEAEASVALEAEASEEVELREAGNSPAERKKHLHHRRSSNWTDGH